MTKNILEIEGLTKRYRGRPAIDQLHLRVERGSIWGIVGPNGSGKTTLFSILAGLRKQDEGSFKFEYQSNNSDTPLLGVVLDEGCFYHDFSARKNLLISAAIKGVNVERVDHLLKQWELHNTGNKPFSQFSYGMRKRLEIADALLTDPEIIIMDEPINGLDPEGIRYVRELIGRLQDEGKTLLVSGHYLQELEKVCTHFLVLREGKAVFSGTKSDLSLKHGQLENLFDSRL